jgi:AraC-like DNA-binding protein
MSPAASHGKAEQNHGTAAMQPANDFTETSHRSSPSLAGLLVDALGDLPLEQTGVRSKIASALRMVGGPLTPPIHTGGLAPWQVKRLKALIEARLETLIRLDEAATLVGVSSSHFSRAFKRTFGQPFSRYIRSLRLERARALLTNTDRSISDIALACGLSDQPHLTRLFHRRYGAPPHAWRRAHRGR